MVQRIWIIDDDRSIRWVLEKTLSQAGFTCDCFDRGDGVLTRLKRQVPTAIISDIRMPGINGIELLRQLHENHPAIPVVIMTAHSDLDSAVNAYQHGAFEYLPKPFDVDDAVNVIQRAIDARLDQPELPQTSNNSLAVNHLATEDLSIIGEAQAMQAVFRTIGRLAQSDINVLINGACGTGKELVAKALHRHSPRKDKPFIVLNMAAIPNEMMEVELFGSEVASASGANRIRQGRFEQASNGTLFLDEVGDMPMNTQTRLLRVLSDGEFYRVGGQNPVAVNVRIIAATQKNLHSLTDRQEFREDLFHRLNVIRIQLPLLAERKEDVNLLCDYFLRKAASEMSTEPKTMTAECKSYLTSLDWPGNVRQLENLCRLVTAMAPSKIIELIDLPEDILHHEKSQVTESQWLAPLKQWADRELTRGETRLMDIAMPLFEKAMIEIALKQSGGRKRDASTLLGWGRNTLTRKMKDLVE